jgi:hypothetical protein
VAGETIIILDAKVKDLAPRCMECGYRAFLTTGAEIYPHRRDLSGGNYYKCPKCPNSYCGCHRGTKKPLGVPCGPETRNARTYVHRVLDPIWKKSGAAGARRQVYQALADHMGLSMKDTHVGLFDIQQCRKAYRFLLSFRKSEEFEVIEK